MQSSEEKPSTALPVVLLLKSAPISTLDCLLPLLESDKYANEVELSLKRNSVTN